MIDERMARVSGAALIMLNAAHDANITDCDTFAACEYILGTRRVIAENNVIQLQRRGRVEAPSRASRQPSSTGAGALRSVAAPARASSTTDNTKPVETGDNHRLGGLGGTIHVH